MSLKGYRVCLREDPSAEVKFTLHFDCLADDKNHAIEQAQNAYPGCAVLNVTPIGKVKDRYCIFSLNEAEINDSCGFWSNSEGWTTAEDAGTFSAEERLRLTLPLSAGEDATWHRFDSRVLLNGNPYQL